MVSLRCDGPVLAGSGRTAGAHFEQVYRWIDVDVD
jgi:hypothetical protein